jgi:hypothetical protein
MWVVAGILALILEALAGVVVRSSWREWRNVGGPPDSEWLGRFKDGRDVPSWTVAAWFWDSVSRAWG